VNYFELDTQSHFDVKNLCLAIGNFDGFHKGHISILNSLKLIAKEKNQSTAIMSFNPHPRKYFDKNIKNFDIYTKFDKINFLRKYNINNYIEFTFDKNLADLSASKFIENILINKLDIKNVVVGRDFKFGKDRIGNFQILENYSKDNDFNVHLVESMMLNNSSKKYSSSIIRENIENGEIEKANFALGRSWHMNGKVVEGDKRARKINFPTANIIPGKHLYPRKGVYCVEVYVKNKKYFGISNFGERPTVDGSNLLLETHIFNFNEELYGNDLTVQFLTFIRPEQKFNNFNELTKQIKKDIEIAKKYHKI
tara:strand:- start:3851 stop:4780 length:930 start_codon:yes stop_codon:yes gene_type:complete